MTRSSCSVRALHNLKIIDTYLEFGVFGLKLRQNKNNNVVKIGQDPYINIKHKINHIFYK